jgi:hypothetical protein
MAPHELESRVEALERQLAVLRAELRDEIKSAAHELRDTDSFIVPFWKRGTDHATSHFLDRMGRWVLMIVGGAIAGWLLIWLGSTGAFKGVL